MRDGQNLSDVVQSQLQLHSVKTALIEQNWPKFVSVVANWKQHCAEFSEMVQPPEKLRPALQASGAPSTFVELNLTISPELARWAVANCFVMRNHFNLVDLLDLMGLWTDDIVNWVMQCAVIWSSVWIARRLPAKLWCGTYRAKQLQQVVPVMSLITFDRVGLSNMHRIGGVQRLQPLPMLFRKLVQTVFPLLQLRINLKHCVSGCGCKTHSSRHHMDGHSRDSGS